MPWDATLIAGLMGSDSKLLAMALLAHNCVWELAQNAPHQMKRFEAPRALAL
jgi:hypothetical protein